jgi:hypothetical protein
MQLKHRQNILQSTHNFGSKSNMASSTVARHCHQHDDGYIVNAVCAVPCCSKHPFQGWMLMRSCITSENTSAYESKPGKQNFFLS